MAEKKDEIKKKNIKESELLTVDVKKKEQKENWMKLVSRVNNLFCC